MPKGFVTSGLKIPLPPSSNQPRTGCFTCISIEGSVKGKYAGTYLISVAPASSLAKISRRPSKVLMLTPSSITIPSVW